MVPEPVACHHSSLETISKMKSAKVPSVPFLCRVAPQPSGHGYLSEQDPVNLFAGTIPRLISPCLGIVTDAHNVLPRLPKMKNTVDHAAAAERQTHALVISLARGNRIAEVKGTVAGEYQPVQGYFGHACSVAAAAEKRYANRQLSTADQLDQRASTQAGRLSRPFGARQRSR